MKILLFTNRIQPEEMEAVEYDKEQGRLSFTYGRKRHSVKVEQQVDGYVKLYDDGTTETIWDVATY